VHSPVSLSQSDVPQGAVVLVQAVCVQQWPVPLTPQTFDMHSAFEAHGPSEICGVQTPPLALLAQYQPSEQSAAPFAGSQVPAQAVPRRCKRGSSDTGPASALNRRHCHRKRCR